MPEFQQKQPQGWHGRQHVVFFLIFLVKQINKIDFKYKIQVCIATISSPSRESSKQ